MADQTETADSYDLFIIGGGINGCGIARDASGRGLKVGLAEMKDLASATSSASTKLFHGGLRYLEYFEVRLVRESLIERETLMRAMPHISWPMRFVLPFHRDMRFENSTPTSKLLNTVMPWMKGRRPAWLIRLGLLMYDNLGGREILPGTKTLDLSRTPEGRPLKDKFRRAYEYSDCWVQDSRLVVLNARDAEARGADIMTRTKVLVAERVEDRWKIEIEDTESGAKRTVTARMLVNAGGPWAGDIIRTKIRSNSTETVRLVRGSHIVCRKLYDHDKCYFFQGTDGRIIFAIPYEQDFTLIGTTDSEQDNPDRRPECTPEERDYLIAFANNYFKEDLSADDVVWSYSGVRPLYDDGASSATAATRDYTLKIDDNGGAPVLNIFGGKITTYRRLAESAMEKIGPYFSGLQGKWTAGVTLPGGDFKVVEARGKMTELAEAYPFLSKAWAERMIRHYGTDSWRILGDAVEAGDLGRDFSHTLTEAEVRWLMRHEYARTADDVVFRRTRLGIRMTSEEIAALDAWMHDARAEELAHAAQ